MQCCRAFASIWIVTQTMIILFPRHFESGFSKSIRTISKGFPKCFHILKEFKAFQSSRNCFKYSEEQIGFSHGNLYNLHLLSNSRQRKRGSLHKTGFSLPHRYHFDSRSSSKSNGPCKLILIT